MKPTIVLMFAATLAMGLTSNTGDARKRQPDQCYVEVHTNLYGIPSVPCDYRFTMLVNADGTIASSGGGTRTCAGNPVDGLGAGTGTVGSPSFILFPFIADITFDLPAPRDAGAWVLGLVHTLSDRGGPSPVTSSQMICANAP